MSTDNNNYNDNNFNPYQAYSYTLLLKVEATSFSYAVFQQNRLIVSALDCDLQELMHPRELEDLLSASYKKVVVGLPAAGLTLVPNSLFEPDQVANIARYLDVKPTEKVFAQPLDKENMVVFKTEEALVTAVERLGLDNVVYAARGWIKAIEKTDTQTNKIYLEIGKDNVQLLNFAAGKLRYYNSFEFKTPDELVYFTTLVAEELNLKPQYATLILSGDIVAGDKNANRLSDFFRGSEFNDIEIFALPGQFIKHQLLALAALSLCGSSEVL